MDEMRSEGACIASQALRTFDASKKGATSLFSYLSWSFFRGNLSIRQKQNKWDRLNKLFEFSEESEDDDNINKDDNDEYSDYEGSFEKAHITEPA